MVVAARNALFFVRGQLTRSRSPQEIRIAPSKSATKLARQITFVPLVVSMVLADLRRVPTK